MDYSFRSAVGAALALEGITHVSLPRTGRATLMASSSTGEQWCRSLRPAVGWSAPRPLGRLAPALPGPLHPTSTTPSHVFHAGFEARVPYGQNPYKREEAVRRITAAVFPERRSIRLRRHRTPSKTLSANASRSHRRCTHPSFETRRRGPDRRRRRPSRARGYREPRHRWVPDLASGVYDVPP